MTTGLRTIGPTTIGLKKLAGFQLATKWRIGKRPIGTRLIGIRPTGTRLILSLHALLSDILNNWLVFMS